MKTVNVLLEMLVRCHDEPYTDPRGGTLRTKVGRLAAATLDQQRTKLKKSRLPPLRTAATGK